MAALDACPAAPALPVSGIKTPILTLSAAIDVPAPSALAARIKAANSRVVLFISFLPLLYAVILKVWPKKN
jgi:hypothetical protein